MQVCDFSDQAINLEAVKAAGFDGCISYASDDTAKNWTSGNFDACASYDLSRLIVCEQGTQPALRGTLGGMHDSTIAEAQANALGYSSAATLFYVAEDPSQLATDLFDTVAQYFEGLRWAAKRPIGGYGGWALLNYLHGLGLIAKGWMVQTWNQGAPEPLPDWIVLMQMVNGVNTHGLPIDVDNVLDADYGQDPRPPSPKPAPVEVPVALNFDIPVAVADVLIAPGGGVWILDVAGQIYAVKGAPYLGDAFGESYFVGRVAATLTANGQGYTITDTADETYHYGS